MSLSIRHQRQSPVSQSDMDKVTITITCNSKLDHFAAAAAERFPNIRLVQDCYTGQYRISEHVADIEHHDFGDLLMVKAGHIPKVNMSDQLIDLSTQPFPVNFNANLLQADENGLPTTRCASASPSARRTFV